MCKWQRTIKKRSAGHGVTCGKVIEMKLEVMENNSEETCPVTSTVVKICHKNNYWTVCTLHH